MRTLRRRQSFCPPVRKVRHLEGAEGRERPGEEEQEPHKRILKARFGRSVPVDLGIVTFLLHLRSEVRRAGPARRTFSGG